MAKTAPREVTYRVSWPEPATHLYHATMIVPGLEGRGDVSVGMPAWTPGSYKIREFARHVQDLEAFAAGRRLPAHKTDKSTWRVRTEGASPIEVRYKVYANEQTVRTSHLDDRHAYFNGASVFLYVVSEVDRPCRVELDVPPGWKVATALDPAPAEARAQAQAQGPGRVAAFVAPDYDSLIDCPVDASPSLVTFDFDVRGARHEVAIDGRGNYDLDALRQDLARIVESEAALFPDRLPYERYLFIVHCVPEGVPTGGLEHRGSTTLQWNRFKFRPHDKYEDFLALASHELYHAWNGKRVRPRELGPFDYAIENYTQALWVVEGVTSYYDELVLRHAEIVDAERYLKKVAEHVQALDETPGRRHQSLAESSFDAWIKFYQRHEHSVNAIVSYYEKGQLVAWLLDLEIRARSEGRRSLDDVMRALWREHVAAPERGYDLARFEALCAEAAGGPADALAAFFDAYVRGTDDLDYARHLAPFGLTLVEEPKEGGGGKGKKERDRDRERRPPHPDPLPAGEREKDEEEPRAWLGARVKQEGGRAVVSEVLEGSPAWRAGLCAGDELLAFDGFRVAQETLEARLHERKPGARVSLAVFRGDELRTVEATLGAKRHASFAIRPVPDPTPAAARLYEGWLREPYPHAPEEGAASA